MRALCVSLLLCSLLVGLLPPTGAEEGDAAAGGGGGGDGGGGGGEGRVRRSLPYWGMWSSDFYGWLEELRARAAYDGMHDLARTFWAHFPISRELGYDSPDPEPEHEHEE